MVDCVVCGYWTERLKETRAHSLEKATAEQENRLMVALRTHQFGACARRFPGLLRELVKEKVELPGNSPDPSDLARVRILVGGPWNDLGAVPTYDRQ